jgi:hypothetical protein
MSKRPKDLRAGDIVTARQTYVLRLYTGHREYVFAEFPVLVITNEKFNDLYQMCHVIDGRGTTGTIYCKLTDKLEVMK